MQIVATIERHNAGQKVNSVRVGAARQQPHVAFFQQQGTAVPTKKTSHLLPKNKHKLLLQNTLQPTRKSIPRT